MTSDKPQITLDEWAVKQGRSPKYVRNFWRPQAGFPEPVGRQEAPRTTGPGAELYDEAALDSWRADLLATQPMPPPEPYPVPGDPEERLTLGAVARRLGVDGKTVTQYRGAIDERAADVEQRGTRRYYRLGEVIAILNAIRRGRGVAADPGHDGRRRGETSPGPRDSGGIG